MSLFKLNPSISLSDIIPTEIYENSEKFILFLKAYYDWMQTSTIDISNVSGTFNVNEYVIGQSSNALAKILQIKSDTSQLVVLVQNDVFFRRNESIIGQTSAASAKIIKTVDNVLKTSSNLIEYRDLEKSVDKFADYLKYELYQSIPSEISGDAIDTAKTIRDHYQSKSQENSYRYLFKSLYNEEIELIYPGEEILRVSDGKFVKNKIIRTNITSDIFNFLFKTIRGLTSGAIANIVDIKLVNIGSIQVAEITLSLVSGTFIAGETIFDISGDLATTLTLYGMIADFNIINSGSGYTENDTLQITGDGESAVVKINSVNASPINALKVNAYGQGYRLNTYANVDNTGTSGTGLIVKITGIEDTYNVTDGVTNYTVGRVSDIKIVNKGYGYKNIPSITLIDNTISNIGLLHENLFQIVNSGNNYSVGDWLSFSSTTGSGANAIISSVVEYDVTLLLEDDSIILLEDTYSLMNEIATQIGEIDRIKVTNYGSGYISSDLPVITVNTSTGSNANIIVLGVQGTGSNVVVDVANNYGGIGSIRQIEIVDFGVAYTNANVDCTLAGNGDANVVPIISGIGISSGKFINDDGKIDYKKIQDSYFYQDFSYVIRSGIEIATYRDIVKKIIHPAGLEFFGEIAISSNFDVFSKIDKQIPDFCILNVIKNLELRPLILDNTDQKISINIIPSSIKFIPSREYLLWKDEIIFNAADLTINSVSSKTFLDLVFENYQRISSDVTLYTKLSGTVSTYANNTIYGIGTAFESDIVSGDNIVIGDDKFVVSNVVSNTEMTILVDSTMTYSDYSIYKL